MSPIFLTLNLTLNLNPMPTGSMVSASWIKSKIRIKIKSSRTPAENLCEPRRRNVLAARTGTPESADFRPTHAGNDRLAQVTSPLQLLDHRDLDGRRIAGARIAWLLGKTV